MSDANCYVDLGNWYPVPCSQTLNTFLNLKYQQQLFKQKQFTESFFSHKLLNVPFVSQKLTKNALKIDNEILYLEIWWNLCIVINSVGK